MCRTAEVEMPEYFRAEFSLFIFLMRITIAQDIQNRCGHFEIGKCPCISPSTV